MFRENATALLLLYVRPITAASRILDQGRLWFGIVAALAVCVLLHWPEAGVMASALRPPHLQQAEAVPGAQPSATPESVSPAIRAVQQWIGYEPGSYFAPLWATAIFLVPAIVFARAVSGFGSFPVLMRSDYVTLLLGALMSFAAAYLPLAIVVAITGARGPWLHQPVLYYASAAYFVVLLAFSFRTTLGTGFAPAAGLAALGWVVGAGGVFLGDAAGPSRYMLMSPFLLYYGYAMFATDVRSLGDGLRSRQNLRRQLELSTTNPRDADAHYQLGLIYQQRRQYAEAAARFQRAIEIDPSEADYHLQLGRIARQQGRFEDAAQSLQTAASLNEKVALGEVWRELGAAYFQSSHAADAAPILEKYVERRPYDPEGLYWYGKSLAALGRATEARQMFEQCIEAVQTMPSHRRAHVRRWGGEAKSELRALR